MMMMTMKMIFACVILCVFGERTLGCQWMNDKFKQYSGETVKLLENMVKNSTNTSMELDLAYPYDLDQLATREPAEKLSFMVQVLHEVFALFEEDHTAVHWDKKKVDHFLNVLSRQAAELNACIKSHVEKDMRHKRHKKDKKLHMYFKRLSNNVLELKNHSSEAWEIIRKEVKVQLLNIDLLASDLVPIN